MRETSALHFPAGRDFPVATHTLAPVRPRCRAPVDFSREAYNASRTRTHQAQTCLGNGGQQLRRIRVDERLSCNVHPQATIGLEKLTMASVTGTSDARFETGVTGLKPEISLPGSLKRTMRSLRGQRLPAQ